MEEYIVEAKNIKNNEIIKIKIIVNDESDNIIIYTNINNIYYTSSDDSYFEAFKKLKDILLEKGYGLNCLGAKINAVQSAMASGSDKIYIVELGKQASGIKSIFDYCDNCSYPNKEEQDLYCKKWKDSL